MGKKEETKKSMQESLDELLRDLELSCITCKKIFEGVPHVISKIISVVILRKNPGYFFKVHCTLFLVEFLRKSMKESQNELPSKTLAGYLMKNLDKFVE